MTDVELVRESNKLLEGVLTYAKGRRDGFLSGLVMGLLFGALSWQVAYLFGVFK